ncbi:hypothetical protein CL684_00025 [Candidatus Campbellbacteria bacterium]|nr:hypothetical protein [Candidatus Campbellbacteria bacterium]|tara:strand:+ start:2802 stop:4124 length:1323 start_codon:yes stop_codon:yes gene_type:complete
MNSLKVKILSLAPSGHGVAENNWYILGAFPGEIVSAQKYKEAEGITYAELVKIITPSKYRTHTPTIHPFYNPNAPWEHLKLEQENKEKLIITKEVFNKYGIAIESDISKPGSLSSGYRSKAAYAFTKDPHNQISFALFQRGVFASGKIAQSENLLVHPEVNKIGKQFLVFFNQKKVPLELLKYLNLRYSYSTNTVVVHILVTETSRKKLPWKKSDLEKLIENNTTLQGILVSHSQSGMRSSVTTKDFYVIGDIVITESLLDKQYRYYPTQFFQIYPEAFGHILTDCENLVRSIPNHNQYELLDFFAGIGIIGIHLARHIKSVRGVEQSPLAQEYASLNAEQNNIHNFKFTEANVDEALEYIQSKQILVVDPARSGLTKKSLKKIAETQPKYIIYISCNPETQARDYSEFQDFYTLEWSRAYNLFPKTPHIEHVIFLKRKN